MGKAIIINDADFSAMKLTTIVLGKPIVALNAIYSQTKIITPSFPLEYLKDELVVYAVFEDATRAEVSNYTLSGTLAVGTSAIQVAIGNVTTSFNVVVSDWKRTYSFANGDLRKVKASSVWYESTSSSAIGVIGLNSADSGKRRSFVVDDGYSIPLYNITSGDIDGFYSPESHLIEVPKDATQVVVTITPNTQFNGVGLYTYNNETHEFIRAIDNGWKQGTTTLTFSSNIYSFMSIGCKYNSGGTTYPTEPSELTIEFT